jgi:hypothetical protein
VEDGVWKSQLETLAGQILVRLDKILGQRLVTWIEFREVPARVPPQRAELARGSQDEASRIEDPVLRMVYRTSRKRALGN